MGSFMFPLFETDDRSRRLVPYRCVREALTPSLSRSNRENFGCVLPFICIGYFKFRAEYNLSLLDLSCIIAQTTNSEETSDKIAVHTTSRLPMSRCQEIT